MFNSKWITSPDAVYSDNRLFAFKKDFDLDDIPESAKLNISAEARYKLFVNGKRAAFGPCRSSAEEKYYDTLDIAEYLHKGSNTLYCEVLQLAENSDVTKPCLIFAVRRSGNIALALELCCVSADGKQTEIRTDDSWTCAVLNSRDLSMRRRDLSASTVEEHLISGNICSDSYKPAKILMGVDAPRDVPFVYGIINPLFVRPRPIPMLYQKEVKFTEDDEGYYIADELTFGFPAFEFSGHGTVTVTYSESFGSGAEKGDRLDHSKSFGGASDIIDVDGNTSFEPFWYRTARIIKIDCTDGVVLEKFTFTEVGYPLTYPSDCDFGSDVDNKLWKISVATLMRCMQETYEDCPYYEQLQYDMDTSLQMLYNYQITDDDALARKAIHDFRLSALGDGLLSSRYPTVELQYIPSFCFYYIFMVAEHYKRFGDKKLVCENLRAIDGVLEWFEGNMDECGLLHRTMYWDFVDWAVPWNRTRGEAYIGEDPDNNRIVTIVSAMYVYFLREAAKLSEVGGRYGVAAEYRDRANKVAQAIENLAWDKERCLYADDLAHGYYSQHMQVWCVLSGIARDGRAHLIMENALELDTKCTFAYAYFWFRALETAGLYSETDKMINRLRALPSLNCTTIPETPDAPRSDCHAWGAIAIYEFAAVVLGVRTKSVEDREIDISPYIDGRDHARGNVFTGCGRISVDWKKSDNIFTIKVHSDDKCGKYISLPNGKVIKTDMSDISLACSIK